MKLHSNKEPNQPQALGMRALGWVDDSASSARRQGCGAFGDMSSTAIQSIQHGIVFLLAEWSGGSKWAHHQLVKFLEQRGIPLERLHVLDLDRHPELYDLPEFVGRIHGWGEAAVVRDGRIVFVAVLGRDPRRIQEHCDGLFRAYEP